MGDERTGKRDLSRLLAPRSIAFVGGADAAEAVRVCRRFGYNGAIWPVSPSRADMDGVPAVSDLSALPGPPDAAFVGVNRAATPGIVAELAAMGAGGAIAYASGFRESVSEIEGGAGLEADLAAAAGDMPLLGPNCYGLINAASGASIWPSEHGVARTTRGVALISQSTNIVISMTMQRRGLPVAFVATVGNQAQTGLSDLGRAALAQDNVTALGIYIEGIDSAKGFEAMAAEARARGKPIVVLKSGRSETARVAMLSHTASLAGSDQAADAFFERLGVARVRSIPALLEALKVLHVHGSLSGPRVGAICCSGGETAVIADAAEGRDVVLPALEPAHREAVKATLPPMVSVANPLDYHTFHWGQEDKLAATYSAMLRGPFDFGFLTLDWVRTDRCSDAAWEPSIRAIERAAAETETPVGVLATLPDNLPEATAERLVGQGIVPLYGVDDGLEALEAAARIGAAWAKAPADPLAAAPVLSGRADHVFDEAAAKALLAAHGVPTPRGGVASVAQARAAAERIDGPVAVKALGVAHKTEARAVRLGVAPDQAESVAAEIAERLGVDRFLIEEMAPPPIAELIVGVTRDDPYGLSLTIGAGGVLTELLRDTRTVLLPARDDEIRAALAGLRMAPMLTGYRGRPGVDLEATVRAIAAIAQCAETEAHRLVELDVNPLMLNETGAVVADALLHVEGS